MRTKLNKVRADIIRPLRNPITLILFIGAIVVQTMVSCATGESSGGGTEISSSSEIFASSPSSVAASSSSSVKESSSSSLVGNSSSKPSSSSASTAYQGRCKDTQGKDYYCEWVSGCYAIDTRYAETPGQSCSALVEECRMYGRLLSGTFNEGDGITCQNASTGNSSSSSAIVTNNSSSSSLASSSSVACGLTYWPSIELRASYFVTQEGKPAYHFTWTSIPGVTTYRLCSIKPKVGAGAKPGEYVDQICFNYNETEVDIGNALGCYRVFAICSEPGIFSEPIEVGNGICEI